MTRSKAFSIHLTISAAIALIISALMLTLWYTTTFFTAAGGQKLLLIILLVDITVGPLITLIIFNNKKSRKELTFDLAIIATIQIAALVYGMSVMHQSRPVFITFNNDAFILTSANEMIQEDLPKSKYPEFRSLPLTGPIYAYAAMPTTSEEISEIQMASMFGKGLHTFPQHLKPYTEFQAKVGQTAKPISELKILHKDLIKEIEQEIKITGKSETAVGFLPLKGMNTNLTILIDKSDGKVLKVLKIAPY
jgi:hypothetical protein